MSLILQVLLILTLVTAAAKVAGAVSVRCGQPAVFGEVLAGLLLGPSLLDVLGWGVFAPTDGGGAQVELGGLLHLLAEIGVILLMFVAGLETDLGEMRRVGRIAFWVAFGGVVLPLSGGAAAARLFGFGWGEAFFIGAVLTATSVSISAQTLMELRSLRSREGSAILGAAVIDDVMGIVVLSLVVAFVAGGPVGSAGGGGEPAGPAGGTAAVLAWIVLRIALFFVPAWFLGRRYLERIAAAAVRLGVSQPLLALVVVVAFLYAFAAERVGGVAAITGSYMAGVLFGQTSFKETIDEGIHPLTYSFLVPVFLVDIGLRADVTRLEGRIPLILVILAIAILGKVVGCGVCARFSGMTRAEALRVGVGMISRGEVGLIVAGYGLAHGIIAGDIFSVMVLMVLVTTMITPVWLRRIIPPGSGGPAG